MPLPILPRAARFLVLPLALGLFPALASAQTSPTRPRIFIAATGGTIAGAQADVGQHGYTAGTLGVDALIAAVPRMRDLAEVTGEQVMNIPSQDMDDAAWLKLARRLQELENRDDITGIVVTHGTDTLEETALFVALTVKAAKPIIFTGAMRPATAIGADGPANLYNAVAVAASPQAAPCGVLAVFNDQIHHAARVYKTHTTRVDAFQSGDAGAAGAVDTGHVGAINGCPAVPPAPLVAIGDIQALPRVEIIEAHAGMGRELIDAAVKAGARGLVLAGVGNGNATKAALAALADARAHGVVVVRSSRVAVGPTLRNAEVDDDKLGFVASGLYRPSKARVLLQLALLKSGDPATIQALFDR